MFLVLPQCFKSVSTLGERTSWGQWLSWSISPSRFQEEATLFPFVREGRAHLPQSCREP